MTIDLSDSGQATCDALDCGRHALCHHHEVEPIPNEIVDMIAVFVESLGAKSRD
jgi:hypothetical protein